MANEAPAAAPVDSKTIAGNIVQGIQRKADGKAPEPSADKAPTPPIDPNAGKKKYAVEGKEVWLTPEDADRYVQKGLAFEPKVTQLGHLQNEVGQFLKTLSQDPLKVLTDKRIGLTPDAVLDKLLSSGMINEQAAEKIGKWYYENVVHKMRDPEAYERAQKDKRLTEYEQREKAERENAQKKALEAENAKRIEAAMIQIKAEISEAMKDSGLPTNDSPLGVKMARMVADVMRVAKRNQQAITPKQAIEHVKQELKDIQRAYFDHLEGDALIQEIGEANAEKVKKYFLKLVKDQNGVQPENKQPSTRKTGERKILSQDEFRDYLDGLKKENAPTRFK